MLASPKKSTSKVNFFGLCLQQNVFQSVKKGRVMWGASTKTAQNRWPQGRHHFWSVRHDTLQSTTAEQHQNPGVDREVTAHRPQILLRKWSSCFCDRLLSQDPQQDVTPKSSHSANWPWTHAQTRSNPQLFFEAISKQSYYNIPNTFPESHVSPACL